MKKLAQSAGLYLDIGPQFVAKLALFDVGAPNGIASGQSNFNALISAVPLAADGMSAATVSADFFGSRASRAPALEALLPDERASEVDGGWQPVGNPTGTQGGSFAPFAPALVERAPFLGRLSSATVNRLKTSDTFELTGCPLGRAAGRAAGAGDPFRVYGVSSDPVLQPSGLMACQNRDSCVLCDSADPRPGDCVTNAATGMTPLDPVSLSLPCNPDRCYGERWFANVRGVVGGAVTGDIGFPSEGCSDAYVEEVKGWLRDPDAKLAGLNSQKAVTALQVRAALVFLVDYQMAGDGYGASYPVDLPEGCSRECWEDAFFENATSYDGVSAFFPFAPLRGAWNPTGDEGSCCRPANSKGGIDSAMCAQGNTNCQCCDPTLSIPIGPSTGAEILIANDAANAERVEQIVVCGASAAEVC